MPYRFDQSIVKGFGASFCKARNVNGQISSSVLVAAVPYQGYGNAFSVGSIISDSNMNQGPGPNMPILTGGIDSNDNAYTYRTYEKKITLDNGYWAKEVTTYETFFVNGYGATTLISTVASNSDPSLVYPLIYYYSRGTPSYSSTVLSRTGNCEIGWYDGVTTTAYAGDIHFTISLLDRLDYADAVSNCLAILQSTQTPEPDSSVGSSTGKHKVRVLWPDTASTVATRNNSGDSYMIAAANGMITNTSTTLIGGTIASNNSIGLSLGARSIICAKSKWYLRNKSYNNSGGKPKAPWDLYFHPMDSSAVPQSVVNLSRRLGYSYNEFTVLDIPPYGFTPPYNPPYTPNGYGEIGFESST